MDFILPITVQNVGYIYSSQPIFIVFKLFHILILREAINVHMLGWKFVPQSGNNNNVLAKKRVLTVFLALSLC